jgi:hypothetical protein
MRQRTGHRKLRKGGWVLNLVYRVPLKMYYEVQYTTSSVYNEAQNTFFPFHTVILCTSMQLS